MNPWKLVATIFLHLAALVACLVGSCLSLHMVAHVNHDKDAIIWGVLLLCLTFAAGFITNGFTAVVWEVVEEHLVIKLGPEDF